jgi:hypothetical protein
VLVLGDHKGATEEHTGREVRGVEGGSVEVADHSIRFPPPHELDDHGVDIGTEESHGTTGTKGSSADVGWGEAKRGTNKLATGPQGKCQMVTGNLGTTASWQEDGEQGSIG